MRGRWMVLLAVCVAAAIGATLAGASSWVISSGAQIKDGVIPASKLTPGARAALAGNDGERGKTGARGARGPNGKDGKDGTDGTDGKDGRDGKDGAPGATGATGPQGAAGDSYLLGAYYAVAYYDSGDTNQGAIATVACASQSDTAISGGVQTIGLEDSTPTPVSNSFPGRMDWDTNTPKPDRLDGWIVQFNGTDAPIRVKVYALCVPNLTVPVVTTYTESG